MKRIIEFLPAAFILAFCASPPGTVRETIEPPRFEMDSNASATDGESDSSSVSEVDAQGAGEGVGRCAVAAFSAAEREQCLLENLTVSREWSPGALAAPFGYICLWYGFRGSVSCEHDGIRMVTRWTHDRATDSCPIIASVYWAPGRAPGIEEKADDGVRAFDSDGVGFLFAEADDYVIELQTCAKQRDVYRSQLVGWAASLRELLLN